MRKLIKPTGINNILKSGVVLHSKKAYLDIGNGNPKTLNNCAVRQKENLKHQSVDYSDCRNVRWCEECFLKTPNYLNILKYLKHNKIE